MDTNFEVEIYTEDGETFVHFGSENGSGAEYPANNKEELMTAFETYIDNYIL